MHSTHTPRTLWLLPLALLLACSPKAENKHEGGCVDLTDNDEDGQVDCVDPDCTPTAECAGYRIGLTIETLEKEIVALNQARNERFETLYAAYGGGSAANEVTGAVQKAQGENPMNNLTKMFTGAIASVDKDMFKARCQQLGSGAATSGIVDPNLTAFMARPDTKAACTEIEASRRAATNKAQELAELKVKRAALPAR